MENNKFDILAPQKEQVISEVLKELKVDLINLEYIKQNCSIKMSPDGRQIFYFQEKPLVEFYPIEVKQIREEDRIKLMISQKYRKLNHGN